MFRANSLCFKNWTLMIIYDISYKFPAFLIFLHEQKEQRTLRVHSFLSTYHQSSIKTSWSTRKLEKNKRVNATVVFRKREIVAAATPQTGQNSKWPTRSWSWSTRSESGWRSSTELMWKWQKSDVTNWFWLMVSWLNRMEPKKTYAAHWQKRYFFLTSLLKKKIYLLTGCVAPIWVIGISFSLPLFIHLFENEIGLS